VSDEEKSSEKVSEEEKNCERKKLLDRLKGLRQKTLRIKKTIVDGSTDYSVYYLNYKEWIIYGLLGAVIAAVLVYVFYRSKILAIILIPVAALYPLLKKRDLLRARAAKLRLQFKEGILILASALSAGFSMENAMSESESELKLLFGDESMMAEEFSCINHKVSMNIPVENAWDEFAARSNDEDISNFAAVIRVAKRSGGDMSAIIAHSADVIGDKIRIEEDIKTVTAGKRFEQRIMNVIPVVIILYIDITSPGFFDVMYEGLVGRIIMTACLAVYIAAILLSRKLLEIKV